MLFQDQLSTVQTHTRPSDHPSHDPSDTNKYNFYLFSWCLSLFNFMHQWWENELINSTQGVTADTIKKIGSFAMVIEKSTHAHTQSLTTTYLTICPVATSVSPAALKPGVAFCSEKPSLLCYSPLCCWPVKNVHSTWFRSPTAPLDPHQQSLKWVMDSLHLWSGREERRILVHKNRAGACRSRRRGLNEGCNHQLFKTLNHGVARCCCTNTHVHAHRDKCAHTDHRLFKLCL